MTTIDARRTIIAWLEQAREDLKTAKSLLNASRYTWCAFICQQTLEKCLKAGYVKREQKIPPYTHKLEYLCQLLQLQLPEDILKIIILVDKYYIATRYPSYKKSVNISSKDMAASVYKQTEKVFTWLLQTLELEK